MSLISNNRVGIYGGSFDPFHEGHRSCLEAARDELNLERIIVCPSYASDEQWGKQQGANPQERLDMCELALAGMTGIELSDVDIVRESCTYTIDTLEDLTLCYPRVDEWIFIAGSDAIDSLPRWYRFDELAHRMSFARVSRKGYMDAGISKELRELLGSRLYHLELDLPEVSSTEIRERLRQGESITGLVCPTVERYIKERGLYSNPVRTDEKVEING